MATKSPLGNYYSYAIIIVLSEGESHFNKLHRTLNSRGIKISKPTLSTHLKRLVKDGYVKREQKKGVQLVSYSANLEKTYRMKKYWKRFKAIKKFYGENQKEFFSFPESKQVSLILQFWVVRKLNEIKANVEFRLDSESLDKRLALLFWTSSLLDYVEQWLEQKCSEDEEYKSRIFREIDNLLKKGMGV